MQHFRQAPSRDSLCVLSYRSHLSVHEHPRGPFPLRPSSMLASGRMRVTGQGLLGERLLCRPSRDLWKSPCWGCSGWSFACDFSECHFPSSLQGLPRPGPRFQRDCQLLQLDSQASV